MVHVCCGILCCILTNLTSDVVLGMDWFHAINPQTSYSAYSLSLDCRGNTVHLLHTILGCSHANIEVCALKLVLKTLHCDKVSAWFGAL